MNLEQLLIQLASLTERAQQIWEAEQRADEDNEIDEDDEFDFDGDDRIWLALVQNRRVWHCGWQCQPDEATEWALMAEGATPLAAAQALLEHIQEPTSNPELAPTPDNPF